MTDTEPPATGDTASLPPGVADEQFAARLREERERKGLSQADIAKRMTESGWNWPPQTVQKIEAGNRKVSVGEGLALAKILGTTVDLLTWPGREASAASLLAEFTHRAADAWEQLSEWTASLMHAQSQISLTLSEAEKGGYLGSARIRKLAAEAQGAVKLSPEEAVTAGREGFAALRASVAAGQTEEAL